MTRSPADSAAGRVSPPRRLAATPAQAVKSLRTVRDLLRWATSRLAQADASPGHGTLSLSDEASQLVLWALRLAHHDLPIWYDARLSPEERRVVAELVELRCTSRRPAAYLTGEAWLRGVCFKCDGRALVPRSVIAEALDNSFAEHVDREDRPPDWPATVLDLCTGGGSLAILAAIRFPEARIVGADLSTEALALARENIELHGLSGQIELVQGDLFGPVRGTRFDLILCNPPYVNEASMQALPAEFRCEPEGALAGGHDGMDIVRRVLAKASQQLAADGMLLIEIGHEARHFERAFPRLEFSYLPVEAGETMLVLVNAAALRRTGSLSVPPTRRK